ncbi:MAG: hypothetical protein AB7O67_09675 [Vicinamibacterales bacterium]
MRCFALVFAAALAATAVPALAGPASATGGPRVRPGDEKSALLLRDGTRRSPTFARMLAALAGGDLIVYVTMDPRMPRGLGGTLTWMSESGGMRYVRISLNPGLRRESAVAALGHELRHALEVAAHREVTSGDAFFAFYAAVGEQGILGLGSFDTATARDAGEAVRLDLRRTPAPAWPPGTFGPDEWYAWYGEGRTGDAHSIQGPQ